MWEVRVARRGLGRIRAHGAANAELSASGWSSGEASCASPVSQRKPSVGWQKRAWTPESDDEYSRVEARLD